MGYPLKSDTFGGGFVYGMKDNMVVGRPADQPRLLRSLPRSAPGVPEVQAPPLISGICSRAASSSSTGPRRSPVGGYFSIPKLYVPRRHDHRRRRQPLQRPEDQGHRPGHAGRACWRPRPSSRVWSKTTCPTSRLAGYGKALAASRRDEEAQEGAQLPSGHDSGSRTRADGRGCGQFLFKGRVLSDRLPAEPDHMHMKKIAEKYGTATPSAEAIGDIKYDGTAHLRQRDRRLLLRRHARRSAAVPPQGEGPRHLLRQVRRVLPEPLRAILSRRRLRDGRRRSDGQQDPAR